MKLCTHCNQPPEQTGRGDGCNHPYCPYTKHCPRCGSKYCTDPDSKECSDNCIMRLQKQVDELTAKLTQANRYD